MFQSFHKDADFKPSLISLPRGWVARGWQRGAWIPTNRIEDETRSLGRRHPRLAQRLQRNLQA